jgi:hypothetical protein
MKVSQNYIGLRKTDSAKLNFRKASAGKNADLQSCIALQKKRSRDSLQILAMNFKCHIAGGGHLFIVTGYVGGKSHSPKKQAIPPLRK